MGQEINYGPEAENIRFLSEHMSNQVLAIDPE